MPRGSEWPLELRELQAAFAAAAKEVSTVFQQEILFINEKKNIDCDPKKIIDCESSVSVCDCNLSVALPLTDP